MNPRIQVLLVALCELLRTSNAQAVTIPMNEETQFAYTTSSNVFYYNYGGGANQIYAFPDYTAADYMIISSYITGISGSPYTTTLYPTSAAWPTSSTFNVETVLQTIGLNVNARGWGGIFYKHSDGVGSCCDWSYWTKSHRINIHVPTPSPTPAPTNNPTSAPSNNPTTSPTPAPTDSPTSAPTNNPTPAPTANPTAAPTDIPSASPTKAPSRNPTQAPNSNPSRVPTTNPTAAPTDIPSAPTQDPTADPTGVDPTADPTDPPTVEPTSDPTTEPTYDPTHDPTAEPTSNPTTKPTAEPTVVFTEIPSTSTDLDEVDESDGSPPQKKKLSIVTCIVFAVYACTM